MYSFVDRFTNGLLMRLPLFSTTDPVCARENFKKKLSSHLNEGKLIIKLKFGCRSNKISMGKQVKQKPRRDLRKSIINFIFDAF